VGESHTSYLLQNAPSLRRAVLAAPQDAMKRAGVISFAA